ncbi:MAG: hypothetical protein LBK70_00830 [Clostridiales bacterium]|jgi:hypothetical protein|nr:hypothetical protein [Clostridiales bacterium]
METKVKQPTNRVGKVKLSIIMALVITLPISALMVAVLRSEYNSSQLQASIQQEQLARQEYLDSARIISELLDNEIVDNNISKHNNPNLVGDNLDDTLLDQDYQDVFQQVLAQIIDNLIQSKFIQSYNDFAIDNTQISQMQQAIQSITEDWIESHSNHGSNVENRFLWLVRHDFYITITAYFQRLYTGYVIGLAVAFIAGLIIAALMSTGVGSFLVGAVVGFVTELLLNGLLDGVEFKDITRHLGSVELPEIAWSQPPAVYHTIRII